MKCGVEEPVTNYHLMSTNMFGLYSQPTQPCSSSGDCDLRAYMA